MAGGSSTRFLSEAHGRVGRWLRNKWHLDSLIAIGGMAAVYCSTHRNGARAAIKLLHSQYTRNDQARRRFLAEGYAANKVGHRNAVLVLDDDTTEDGEVYLVMELLEGESLEGRLERLGVMGPMEVLAIADQLLEVLAAAHPKGILHRDIKPANIYLTRDGSVKLLDFGLARVRELSAEALDQSDGIVFGTVSYIAPEQARADNQNLDARSDMWSIAATMFRALSGETVHPSTGPIIERLLAVSRKPARSLASLVPQLPRPVIELVDRALAFDPEDRWPSANVMRVVVQDVMAQLQEEAEREHIAVELQQPQTSRRTNTLPVTTKAKTLELPSVRPGLGAGSVESGTRPKTDPIGLSTRPRNLPPSTPAPPDGDETELDLDGLYDKAEAASQSQGQSQGQSPARSRTLLTKEGRAELRRILDARKAGTTTPDAEPVEEPRPARRLAGPAVSGVGDIAVEFEDSIIEVTIDHTHKRSGPIAVRIADPSSATPMPVAVAPSASASQSSVEIVIKPDDSAPALAGSSVSGTAATFTAAPLASESAVSISVEEDEDEDEDEGEEVEEAEDDASNAPSLATSKAPSNLRPPSMPPQQPVPPDRRVSPLATRTTTLVDSQPRMARPPQPPAVESRPPVAAASTREITKVGPAPVAPPAPPAREGSQPTPRANAGVMHDTMRAASPGGPQARGLKDDPRPAAGPTGGMLNATIRPGAAPPPAQARPPADEPTRSTVFTAPVRPGSASEPARPPSEANTTFRSSSFVPPPGRPITRAPTAVDDPARAPNASVAPVAPVAPTASKLPTAGPRPASAAAASVDVSAASTSGIVASPIAATSGASKSVANPVATTSPAANPVAPTFAAASTGASKAAATPVVASSAAASKAAVGPVAASSAAAGAAASKAVATPVAASSAVASKVTAIPAAASSAGGPIAAASKGAASLIAATPSKVAAAGGTASKDPASSGATGAAATAPVAAKPAASTSTTVSAPTVPSAPTVIPITPGTAATTSRTAGTRTPMPAPVVTPVVVPTASAPAPSKPAPVAAAPSEPAPARPAELTPTPAPEPTPAPVRAGKSMFNPYPSLAGGARPEGASTAKTASYAAVGGADSKDSPVVSPNPRSSPNAKTAPHAAAEATVPKDSPAAPGPQDSSSRIRVNNPNSKTAAYPTVGSEEPKPSDSTRSPVKTGAAPVLPFSFLRPAAKTGEAAGSTPEDPKNPGRKKP